MTPSPFTQYTQHLSRHATSLHHSSPRPFSATRTESRKQKRFSETRQPYFDVASPQICAVRIPRSWKEAAAFTTDPRCRSGGRVWTDSRELSRRIMLRTRNSKVTDEHESISSSSPDSSPRILLISDGSTHPTATCSATGYNQVFGPVAPARSQRCPEKIRRVLPNDVMIIPGFMLPDSTQSMQPGCSDRALRPITVATYPREGRYRSSQYHNRSIMREARARHERPKIVFCRSIAHSATLSKRDPTPVVSCSCPTLADPLHNQPVANRTLCSFVLIFAPDGKQHPYFLFHPFPSHRPRAWSFFYGR